MYSEPPLRSTMLKLWLTPKVWLHGSQSSDHHLALLDETPALGDGLLVGAQHALGIDDCLGAAGGAGGQQVAGMGVAVDTREGVHHRRGFLAVVKRCQFEGPGISWALRAASTRHCGCTWVTASVGVSVVDEDQPRFEQRENALELCAAAGGLRE